MNEAECYTRAELEQLLYERRDEFGTLFWQHWIEAMEEAAEAGPDELFVGVEPNPRSAGEAGALIEIGRQASKRAAYGALTAFLEILFQEPPPAYWRSAPTESGQPGQ
jgi:hypothetical protein